MESLDWNHLQELRIAEGDTLDPEEMLKSGIQVVDVRSPGEFAKGHIPGAYNLPLFSDEERALIGTIYKQKGPYWAYLEGVKWVGPKMESLVVEAHRLADSRPIILHCWRGGKRSQSMAWLLRNSGLEVRVLEGGYKAYRQFIHGCFASEHNRFVVLGGRTGSAKTAILRRMMELGEPVLDLEALAHHKGSAFGWIGEADQLHNEQFENQLFDALYRLQTPAFIWVENESRTIGRNYIPDVLWAIFKKAPLINIEVDFESRLDHLVECYSIQDADALIKSFEKINRRLGTEITGEAIELVRQGRLREAAGLALRYYDKCYDYNLQENTSPRIFNLDFTGVSNRNRIADQLIEFKQKQFGTETGNHSSDPV